MFTFVLDFNSTNPLSHDLQKMEDYISVGISVTHIRH